jgi:hypothetical protein
VPSGQATNTNFIVFGLNRSGQQLTIYRNRGEHATHYTTDAVDSLQNNYNPLFVERLMSYLRLKYLCLFAHSGVQHILCCGFVFLRLVYPMLPVYKDCPFVIPTSVFSNVYIKYAKIYILVYCLPTYKCVLKSN